MKRSEAVAAWESPRNEGSAYYAVGQVVRRWVGSRSVEVFTVGRIDPVWQDGRVDIYDTDGTLRVGLPYGATAVEWGPAVGDEPAGAGGGDEPDRPRTSRETAHVHVPLAVVESESESDRFAVRSGQIRGTNGGFAAAVH